jgi:cell division protein FtsX
LRDTWAICTIIMITITIITITQAISTMVPGQAEIYDYDSDVEVSCTLQTARHAKERSATPIAPR